MVGWEREVKQSGSHDRRQGGGRKARGIKKGFGYMWVPDEGYPGLPLDVTGLVAQ
jgi:hypothetical protein